MTLVAVFALVFGLCLPGCSENPSSSSEPGLQQDEASFFDLPFDETSLAKAADDPNIIFDVIRDDELFNAIDGGTLVIGSGGALQEFVVAPYSMEVDAVIAVEVTKIDSKSREQCQIIYDFQPDGLVFAVPATLRVDVARVLGKRSTCANIYHLNEDTGRWEHQGTYCADPVTGIAEIPIPHFSKWGMD